MKQFIWFTFLLCLALSSQAAFPIANHQSANTIHLSTKPEIPFKTAFKERPFTTISAYTFLVVCLSIALLTFAGFSWINSGVIWLQVVRYTSAISVITALLGNLTGEGKVARIMLFLSLFFLFVVLLFL